MNNSDYLANIVRDQSLSNAELDSLRALREQIERQLSVLEGGPRFYYGGSFGKHTIIKAGYDLDLVMYWPHTATYSIQGITGVRLTVRSVLQRADLAGACRRKWVVSI